VTVNVCNFMLADLMIICCCLEAVLVSSPRPRQLQDRDSVGL